MPRVIFLFFDGVGVGRADRANPFYTTGAKHLPFYQSNHGSQPGNGGTPLKTIDALLGVDGLPTSASGQTTLFTGVNIPRLLNQHKGSYPDKTMRRILTQGNILLTLRRRNVDARFLNAYPAHREYFTSDHIAINEDGEFYFSEHFPRLFQRRISVTSCMLLTTLTQPFDERDILAERSIYQDYSNKSLIEKGLDVPEFSPEKAAEVIYNASRSHDFLLYEYFQTDMAGHNAPFDQCEELVSRLDRLVGRLISLLDPTEDTLLITSDHGNLEDGDTRMHTLNPVPLVTWGRDGDILAAAIDSLEDVTPAILDYFRVGTAQNT